VGRGKDGHLRINDGVTRATRAAKLRPGELVPAEIIQDLPQLDVTLAASLNKGKVMLGIYEIDGDTLKVCFDLQGKKRPREFKSASGSPTFVNVNKRVKI
jgi:hypothetical protein